MNRKFTAQHIFDGNRLLKQTVLITTADGTVLDLVNKEDAGSDVITFDGIITPGFVNCHCHLELSYLKNKIPRHTGLVDFVLQVLAARNAPMAEKLAPLPAEIDALYKTGTVAVGDICNTTDTLAVKSGSPLHWVNFIEASGFVDAVAGNRLGQMQLIEKEFSRLPYPSYLVPHAPYSVSKKLFELINTINQQLISVHNQEAAAEDELYQIKSGDFLRLYEALDIDIKHFSATKKSSLQSWLPYFTNGQQIISVHNTFTSKQDISFAKNIFYCICINANLYIENALPPLSLLIENDCKMVIGTDSLASNAQLNMVVEMKTIQQNFINISTETLLQWATSNGAAALKIDDLFGSFAKGKKPGVVLIDAINEDFSLSSTSVARRLL